MNNTARIILIIIALICLNACTKEKREATYNSQEDKIEKYISSNMYKKTTEDGTSIIPISKVTVGYVVGGGEYSDTSKKKTANRFPMTGG